MQLYEEILECGITLAGITFEGNRHPGWKKFRDQRILEVGRCEFCGGRKLLQLHHKRPFHLWPELELERNNTCVLCEAPDELCHLKVGHLGNFKIHNPAIDLMLWLVAKQPNKKDETLWNEVDKLMKKVYSIGQTGGISYYDRDGVLIELLPD